MQVRRIALANPPWYDDRHPAAWGVRAGSRWPHFQPLPPGRRLPRYVPFPFSLAIAAAACRAAGYEVRLLDGVAAGWTRAQFLAELESFQPDLLFFETSTPSLAHDLALWRACRARLPRAHLAAGGAHDPALAAELMARESLPDSWLAGEFDLAVVALAEALAGRGDLAQVPGLGRAGQPAPRAEVADLDALPMPLYEQLPVDHYADPVCGLPAPVAQTWLSRGCPFHCTFCVWPQVVYGHRRYRTRSIARALDEVDLLVTRYGCESFYFDDDTANLGEARMLELAAEIKRRGLHPYPWSMMARADCMTPAMIDALAGAGLYSVKYGVESIAPDLINACDKQTHLDRFHDAIRRTRAAGVKMHLTFTFGIPGETTATMAQTLEFALQTAPETAQFSVCTPFPGTAFYTECVRHGWLTTQDWSRFIGSDEAVVATPWLSAADLQAGYRQAVAAWGAFTARRLAARQARLVRELETAVAAGASWTLLGDRDFAQFLWAQGSPALLRSFTPVARDPAIVAVVVARHDEERIRRRLLRDPSEAGRRIVTLYRDV